MTTRRGAGQPLGCRALVRQQPSEDSSAYPMDPKLYASGPENGSNFVPANSPTLLPPGLSLRSSPRPASLPKATPEGFQVSVSPSGLRCFDYGCNGRQFSQLSNLEHHRREKSGNVRAICPYCAKDFTRSASGKEHIQREVCRRKGQHRAKTHG
jgi:hypothetical protein